MFDHSVYWESRFTRESEFKDGIYHGKMTTCIGSQPGTTSHYAKGVQHGDETRYWDNGRVRSTTKYVRGKVVGETKKFPKFDNPVPVVVLSLEADERLYTAWGHTPVDEYPRVLNFDEVQQQFKVPEFLRAIHELNLANAIESDDEDCSTFADTIAYFLTVNERGITTPESAHASGVYSAKQVDTYLPLLRKLRFAPGRFRGRPVECRVLAKVSHTFVEGFPSPGSPRPPGERSQG